MSFDELLRCRDHDLEWELAGTGTHMHPDATNRDYLLGLLQCPPDPPTLHVTYWSCPKGCRRGSPSPEEREEIFASWTLRQ